MLPVGSPIIIINQLFNGEAIMNPVGSSTVITGQLLMGKAGHVEESGIYGIALYLPLSLAVKLKLP